MAEGGFDDFEMEDMSREYSEYNDMSFDELTKQRDLLNQRSFIIDREISNDNVSNYAEYNDITNRKKYINDLIIKKTKQMET